MSKGLVIVESPAKARTIGRILGRQYQVVASMGHIRDLPKSKLGVDIEHDFQPTYSIPKAKSKVVSEIRTAVLKADSVFLATDPDREGEAISWHLIAAAKLDAEGRSLRRVVFHEITADAVQKAFKHPRDLDMNLVDAQQARRILDRLVGYKLSPLLWKKVQRGLSAGRVQSVAVRIIVDREREIQSFVATEYWILQVQLAKTNTDETFWARVTGQKAKGKLTVSSERVAVDTIAKLATAAYTVADVKVKDVPRRPSAPFITSTLQQEASRRLRFTASRTMALAQQLYEGIALGKGEATGLITYMRTDSPRMAPSAVTEIRDYITSRYGPSYVPPKPHLYASKGKFAQEAHEAIRPTSVANTPEKVKPYLDAAQLKLYTLIWQRAVASQMAAAISEVTTAGIDARLHDDSGFVLEATSSRMKFPGFSKLYVESLDEPDSEEQRTALPELVKGEQLHYRAADKEQKFTQPPARYTEATLVKALEQKGIGRPSTYAPTLSVIQMREYVVKEAGRFVPTKLGYVVNDLLVEHFPKVVDIGFTAHMEGQLDSIAGGELEWVGVVRDFYVPFSRELDGAEERVQRVDVTEPTDQVCPNCGRPMVVRSGRFGRFIACSGYPECKTTQKIVKSTGAKCPECGADIIEKRTKKAKTFYGCSRYPQCQFATSRRPLTKPCAKCGKLLLPYGRTKGKCVACGAITPLENETAAAPESQSD
ncbi:MAG: type I DNA topoisomerase [Dehalococcoidia bacterium]|nr:type I DNA topoisomerase [Dehalococcoidia bacterium]